MWTKWTVLSLGVVALGACADASRTPSAPTSGAAEALALAPDATMSMHVLVDLGILPGGNSAFGSGINTAGDVAGGSETQPGAANHAVIWNADGTVSDLGVPAGMTEARAFDINDARTVIGTASKGSMQVGFLWKAGQFFEIRAPTTAQFVQASSVNNSDVVVGRYRTAAGSSHAFRFTLSGGFVDVHPLSGYRDTNAGEVDDQGVIAGSAELATGESHAVYWSAANVMTDLGTVAGGTRAFAAGINNLGEIIGSALNPAIVEVPFLWTSATGIKVGMGGFGTAISDRGRFVGRGNGPRLIPVTKTRTTAAVFLPVPAGVTQASAAFINRCGSIAGSIVIFGTTTFRHAVRWQNQPCD